MTTIGPPVPHRANFIQRSLGRVENSLRDRSRAEGAATMFERLGPEGAQMAEALRRDPEGTMAAAQTVGGLGALYKTISSGATSNAMTPYQRAQLQLAERRQAFTEAESARDYAAEAAQGSDWRYDSKSGMAYRTRPDGTLETSHPGGIGGGGLGVTAPPGPEGYVGTPWAELKDSERRGRISDLEASYKDNIAPLVSSQMKLEQADVLLRSDSPAIQHSGIVKFIEGLDDSVVREGDITNMLNSLGIKDMTADRWSQMSSEGRKRLVAQLIEAAALIHGKNAPALRGAYGRHQRLAEGYGMPPSVYEQYVSPFGEDDAPVGYVPRSIGPQSGAVDIGGGVTATPKGR